MRRHRRRASSLSKPLQKDFIKRSPCLDSSMYGFNCRLSPVQLSGCKRFGESTPTYSPLRHRQLNQWISLLPHTDELQNRFFLPKLSRQSLSLARQDQLLSLPLAPSCQRPNRGSRQSGFKRPSSDSSLSCSGVPCVHLHRKTRHCTRQKIPHKKSYCLAIS